VIERCPATLSSKYIVWLCLFCFLFRVVQYFFLLPSFLTFNGGVLFLYVFEMLDTYLWYLPTYYVWMDLDERSFGRGRTDLGMSILFG
jgi:hypothetical protein